MSYIFQNLAEIFGAYLLDFFYFPIWWYTTGVLNVLKYSRDLIADKERSWALLVWIRNIFKPMYGQADIWGKLISFGMRIFQIIVRSLILLFWIIFCLFLLCLWLIAPAYLLYQVYYQLT